MKNIKKQILNGATIFLIVMAIVSLLSDMTHEGFAGISGAYLTLLGASPAAISFVSGLGTLIGYGLRFLTGYLADKTKKYWTLTITGYAIDLLFIPLLALVPENGWMLACGFLLIGKIGNAIKKPAKNTIVSFAAKEKGVGKSFAILEFVDQIGAFLGPTLLFLIMLFTSNLSEYYKYVVCLCSLGIPAIACMILLFYAKHKFPNPENYEKENLETKVNPLKKTYITYIIAACVFAFGFIDFPIVTAFESTGSLIPTDYLALLYSGAMLVDAFGALIFGILYDKIGFMTLFISALLTAPFSIMIFYFNNMAGLIIGIVMWGVGMGAQESIMKAAIATLTNKNNRSKGYGLFELSFGVMWFLGSWLTGVLYSYNLNIMIIVSFSAELIASLLFLLTTYFYHKETKLNLLNDEKNVLK